jgi:hypothetical protein
MCLMRTFAIPDRRSTQRNKGAYALRRLDGDSAHFLMVRSENPRWRSAPSRETYRRGEMPRLRQDFLLELEPCSTHYEMYDR